MAAAHGLGMYHRSLGPDGRLQADHRSRVLCEHHEDWIVLVGERAELVSAKHYGPRFGAYSTMNSLASDGGLAHLFDRWHTMQEKPGCRLVTTAGVNGPAKLLIDISNHLGKLRRAGAELSVEDAMKDHLQSFGKALLKHCTALGGRWQPTGSVLSPGQLDEVMRFLSVFRFQRSPEQDVIRDAAPTRYVKPVLDRLASTAPPVAVWDEVLSLFRERMQAAGPTPTGRLPDVLTDDRGPTTATASEREGDLQNRIVTLDEIDATIRIAIRSFEIVRSDPAETTMIVPDFYEDVWTAEGLSIGGTVRAAEVAALTTTSRPGLSRVDAARRNSALTTLGLALQAKSVFTALNGEALLSATLHIIYKQEVGRWPTGDRADRMLFEAADAHLRFRRQPHGSALGPLTRFLTGLAASASPRIPAALDSFVTRQGEQIGDAHDLFSRRREKPAWLLIDLGPESLGEQGRLAEITWWLHQAGETTEPTTVRVHGGENAMRQAIRELLERMPMHRPLRVDIAAPASLLAGGIDQWLVHEVDGELEPIGAECQVRMRWSQRLHEPRLQRRVTERARDEPWDDRPPVATATELSAADSGAGWLGKRKERAFLVGGDPTGSGSGALRAALRIGFGFVFWYDRYITPDLRAATMRAIRPVPPQARRTALPELPEITSLVPTVIWDDPDGRDGYPLPTSALTENP
ncbi:hypothetical protein CLV67_116135 [Actinoplanes italicus]|uniref:vWA-MoxR associated protein C-terminal domain-containing protein n=2 Tax=Actinoplanes italicus TaxID=113567 RepID=A0A2T0K3F1_9ACTN|nr:hypothetical protein CLV67_116135 [Actinoplanes italicus]